ncbi:MAG: alpha/beta hydrolase fold domain-containing protein [Hyphomicrobiales bacterium]
MVQTTIAGISEEARERRATLEKEIVDLDKSLLEERREWNDYAVKLPLAAGTKEQEETIAGVRCSWLIPDSCSSNDVLLFAHGGGLVTGSIVTHRAFASEIANFTMRKVLLVEYGLIPENSCEVPRDDFVAVFKNLLKARRLLPEQTAFCGDSNGAGVGLAALIHLRDENLPLPACFVSLSGAFDASLSGESMRDDTVHDPVLSLEVLQHWQKIFSGHTELDAPEISPLFGNLQGLPPSLLFAGSCEVWLSDSVRLERRLEQFGNSAKLNIFEGMWHVWMTQTDLPESQNALTEINAYLDLHLSP